jgi:hypothetical protein
MMAFTPRVYTQRSLRMAVRLPFQGPGFRPVRPVCGIRGVIATWLHKSIAWATGSNTALAASSGKITRAQILASDLEQHMESI